MNRLKAAQLHLNKRMATYAGIPTLVYHYGTGVGDFVTLENVGWEGRTAFRMQDRENTRVHWNEMDILIPVDRLLTDPLDANTKFKPKKGHWVEIVYTAPDETQTFEISAPDGEQEVRYSDSQRTRYRIHLKAMKRPI